MKKMLIVDDHADIRRLVRMTLDPARKPGDADIHEAAWPMRPARARRHAE